ncbi:hypothetical protein Pcinc_008927 [Petrolisthes cinctipes]|uniref:Glycosyl hydrolase family 13 catalytic domain-containing protein n=1 Tax=Petrolisthes cinctipes TaxID=88211 RepID=A0AAE1KX17_PETCI|nr:hypothetical protein Pcinc_008927 [Petrolisthes cinctipes]
MDPPHMRSFVGMGEGGGTVGSSGGGGKGIGGDGGTAVGDGLAVVVGEGGGIVGEISIVGSLAGMGVGGGSGGLPEYTQLQEEVEGVGRRSVVGGVGGGCDSDDSHSSISRSDDNEGLPSIIYTSDDSADVGRSDSTCCVDSDGIGYIATHVQLQDDEASRRLLLDSECPSPQPSPQPEQCFTMTHPLAAATFSTDDCKFDRSTSVSSTSSGSSPEAQQPLLPEYQPLPNYPDYAGVEFGSQQDLDLPPTKKMHDPLDMFVDVTEIPEKIQVNCVVKSSICVIDMCWPGSVGAHITPELVLVLVCCLLPVASHHSAFLDFTPDDKPLLGGRVLVGGDVHISARYQDAFYVRWNWERIRQSCIVLNASVLLALLCVGIGLLIQMPRGTECDPEHAWWQGTVLLEVEVPAFRDSDGDGLGDLPGVLSNLDHVQSLGVRGLRLSGMWSVGGGGEAGNPTDSTAPNLTRIDPALGDTSHIVALTSRLHQRGLKLLLDLPLTIHQERGTSLEEVYSVLKFWLKRGVDGFFFPDITEYAEDPALVEAMHEWRNILDQFTSGLEHKVMMVPVALLDSLAATSFPHLGHLLHQLDLIHVPVNLTTTAKIIPEVLESGTAWDSHAALPWINWNMAQDNGQEEEADEVIPPSLGRTILLLFFPGTVSLYCCDDLGPLSRQEESRLPVLSVDGEDGSVNEIESVWHDWKGIEGSGEEAYNQSLATLVTMITARQEKVPIYINGIFDYEGDYHPTKTTNYRVRYVDNSLIILDRFYPRRNQYAVVANLGTTTINQDLSHFYYGGSVLASSHGRSGYITFKNITLEPSEALACVLDL